MSREAKYLGYAPNGWGPDKYRGLPDVRGKRKTAKGIRSNSQNARDKNAPKVSLAAEPKWLSDLHIPTNPIK